MLARALYERGTFVHVVCIYIGATIYGLAYTSTYIRPYIEAPINRALEEETETLADTRAMLASET